MPKLSPELVKMHCIKIHDVDPVLNIAKWTQSHQDRLDILVTARSVSHCMWPSSKPKVAAAISVRLSTDLERPVREEEKAFLSFVCTERGWAGVSSCVRVAAPSTMRAFPQVGSHGCQLGCTPGQAAESALERRLSS